MKIREIQSSLSLKVAAGEKGLDREILGGYCGDLLSDTIANCGTGSIWLTVQSHQNIVAVAVLRELSAIVLVNGRTPDEDTKRKADEEGIPILVSPLPAFQLAGRIYALGIGGDRG